MKSMIIISSILILSLLSGCSDSDSDGGTTPPPTAPTAPTGLSVVTTDFTRLSLSWSTVDGATEYILYRSESAGGNYAQVYSGTSAEFTDTGLAYATEYFYRVSAVNSVGEGDFSDPVTGMTNTPAGFTVTGSPSGELDYTFNYLDDFNGKPRYQSDPIGLLLSVPSSGNQAGLWTFYDQIEGLTLYYHPDSSDFPPMTGWLVVNGDGPTRTVVTPF